MILYSFWDTRYKIYQLDLQVKIEGFLSPNVYPKAGVPQGSNLNPLLFIFVNDMPNPSHHHTNRSQFAGNGDQWAVSTDIELAVEYLQRS